MRSGWRFFVLFVGTALAAACTSSSGSAGSGGASASSGTMQHPTGTPFACGDTTCAAGEYCLSYTPGFPAGGGGGGGGVTYSCGPVPASCASPGPVTCDCFDSSACEGAYISDCTEGPAGDFTLCCSGD
jgi:hypothetical protein